MSVDEQVRRVITDMAPNLSAESLLIEPHGDSAALRPLDGPRDAFGGDLRAWADLMAEAGFLVAMVRDSGGAYLEVS